MADVSVAIHTDRVWYFLEGVILVAHTRWADNNNPDPRRARTQWHTDRPTCDHIHFAKRAVSVRVKVSGEHILNAVRLQKSQVLHTLLPGNVEVPVRLPGIRDKPRVMLEYNWMCVVSCGGIENALQPCPLCLGLIPCFPVGFDERRVEHYKPLTASLERIVILAICLAVFSKGRTGWFVSHIVIACNIVDRNRWIQLPHRFLERIDLLSVSGAICQVATNNHEVGSKAIDGFDCSREILPLFAKVLLKRVLSQLRIGQLYKEE